MNMITYWYQDGRVHHVDPLSLETLGGILGMMSRCTMKDGTQVIGFADPYRTHDMKSFDGAVHNTINLWTWTNLDEDRHCLVGGNETRFDQTWIAVEICDIIHVDAVLYSNPRWGGRLTNRFPGNIG